MKSFGNSVTFIFAFYLGEFFLSFVLNYLIPYAGAIFVTIVFTGIIISTLRGSGEKDFGVITKTTFLLIISVLVGIVPLVSA